MILHSLKKKKKIIVFDSGKKKEKSFCENRENIVLKQSRVHMQGKSME